MITFLRKSLRRLAFGSLFLGVAGFVGPAWMEAHHNEQQQNKVEAAVDKIVQVQYFACDEAAAGALQGQRAQKLHEAVSASFPNLNPGWGQPFELFHSGVKRMTNTTPGLANFVSNYVSIPADYRSGNFSTGLDDLARYTEALSNLGVGVCFDSNLSKLNAGSAYTRDMGIITFNPDLSAEVLAVQARLQLQHLNQELVQPYERVVKSANDVSTGFNQRATQLQLMVDGLKGPVLILPRDASDQNPNFTEVPRKNYDPPRHVQPPPEAAKTAAPTPPAATKTPKVAKK
jgi:hypothetical protein